MRVIIEGIKEKDVALRVELTIEDVEDIIRQKMLSPLPNTADCGKCGDCGNCVVCSVDCPRSPHTRCAIPESPQARCGVPSESPQARCGVPSESPQARCGVPSESSTKIDSKKRRKMK